MIQTFWNERTANERIILIFGLSMVLLLLAFLLVYYPLTGKTNELKEELTNNEALLAWMGNTAPKLFQERNIVRADAAKEVFSIVEENFKPYASQQGILSIVRENENKVTVNFAEIGFDDLIVKLNYLFDSYNIDVEEIQLSKIEKPGYVQAKIGLSRK